LVGAIHDRVGAHRDDRGPQQDVDDHAGGIVGEGQRRKMSEGRGACHRVRCLHRVCPRPGTRQTGTVDVVVSWSGGKDSALALWRARSRGLRPIALLTMLDETGRRSRSHGLPAEVLEAQAAAIGVPLVTASGTWDDYTSVFVRALSGLAGPSVRACVFGDIDIEPHRQWGVDGAADAG